MARPVAQWLREVLPDIAPRHPTWSGADCWLAVTMTMSEEHNPPLYWLGRAFDAVAGAGALDVFSARLRAAHGAGECRGERDAAAQDVLSEICAFAWASVHLGSPQAEVEGAEGPAVAGSMHVYIPSVDARIAPVRLRPRRALREVIADIGVIAAEVDGRLPAARARVLFLDAWHEPLYAQGVGYRIELTEPVREALRYAAGEHGLGYVLTRPFQWGNAIEAQY